MLKRIFSTCAMALLLTISVSQANAAFYLRPEVQFGFLADGHSDTDMGVGGALAWGGAFGQDQRYEVGVEVSRIRYKGEFDYFSYRGVGMSDPEWKKVSTACVATPVQATFRYTFNTDNKRFRPYLCTSLGYSWLHIDFPSGLVGGSSRACLTGSIGGGVRYQLGRRTSVNMGYRYFFSDSLGNTFFYTVRYNAHVFSISVNQLLGRLRK